jgi:hypothetical protein
MLDHHPFLFRREEITLSSGERFHCLSTLRRLFAAAAFYWHQLIYSVHRQFYA